MFWSLSEGLSDEERRNTVYKAIGVAWVVGPAFLLISGWIFDALGIHLADVMIAGGIVLFVLALGELLRAEKTVVVSDVELGAVPLGVPLIVGPAVLTTLVLLRQRYGVLVTWAAFTMNLLLTWGLLLSTNTLMRWVGREGSRVISKVASLILAAFAVMLIRHGLLAVFVQGVR